MHIINHTRASTHEKVGSKGRQKPVLEINTNLSNLQIMTRRAIISFDYCTRTSYSLPFKDTLTMFAASSSAQSAHLELMLIFILNWHQIIVINCWFLVN